MSEAYGIAHLRILQCDRASSRDDLAKFLQAAFVGAALATSLAIAIAVGVVMMWLCFVRLDRLATFAVPAVWMSTAMPGFEPRHLWYLSVGTVLVQMCLSLMLLKREMDRRLTGLEPTDAAV
jgi:hypothetical protein